MTDDELRLERIKILAADLRDNDQLARVVHSARADMRRQVYNLIIPYVSFIPKPFILLRNGKLRQ